MEKTAARNLSSASDKSEVLTQAQKGLLQIYALCLEGRAEDEERIEGEMQGWVGTLIYAGYSHDEIIKAFSNWKIDFEKENSCIDEQLNRIFLPNEDSKLKYSQLFGNMIFSRIVNG